MKLSEVRTQAKREQRKDSSSRLRRRSDNRFDAAENRELKQKAEQGSQQLQGEVLELELESLLRAKFPFDTN